MTAGMALPGYELGSGMSVVGFIGSGHIGGTVAKLAVAAGYEVVLSNSRGPETLESLVGEIGPKASAGTAAQAAAVGDLVVVSIPLKAYQQVPVEPLSGKTVIDTNNYYPERDGNFPELDAGSTTSSELLQEHLPESRVVKVFNNIFFKHLATLPRPAGAADRSALAIAGNDPAAKAEVVKFLDAVGYDTVDTGDLGTGGAKYQPGTPAYAAPYGPFSDEIGTPASADQIRAVLGI